MSQQLSSANRRSAGFTLIEVLISMAVLTVGLIGMAAMVCSTMVFGANAKYMNMANVLASEKLDNLNKWPSTDPNVAAGGALAGPSTCAAGDTYCDQVTVSETSGADYITQTQIVFDPVTNTSNPVTTTIVHTSAGCVDTPANCGVPNPNGAGSTFIRRWQVTTNPVITDAAGNPATVTGARRITVVVSLVNNVSKQPVSFQISMVRP
ncbi:MAG TPA: prepilin-type N-terminal cleavage/methylation domain-containing protein [Terriglobales bacterium]|nr:prepilin-type N-terminal cleavage/methylation domain-containing protein [Terriglobales bacterium]